MLGLQCWGTNTLIETSLLHYMNKTEHTLGAVGIVSHVIHEDTKETLNSNSGNNWSLNVLELMCDKIKRNKNKIVV